MEPPPPPPPPLQQEAPPSPNLKAATLRSRIANGFFSGLWRNISFSYSASLVLPSRGTTPAAGTTPVAALTPLPSDEVTTLQDGSASHDVLPSPEDDLSTESTLSAPAIPAQGKRSLRPPRSVSSDQLAGNSPRRRPVSLQHDVKHALAHSELTRISEGDLGAASASPNDPPTPTRTAAEELRPHPMVPKQAGPTAAAAAAATAAANQSEAMPSPVRRTRAFSWSTMLRPHRNEPPASTVAPSSSPVALKKNHNNDHAEDKDSQQRRWSTAHSPPLSQRAASSVMTSPRRRYKLEDFTIGPIIGRGFFSEVCVVEHKRTHERFALKSIKEVRDTSARVAFMKEVELLCSLHHPHVLVFRAVFVSVTSLHLLTDLMEGGTLRKLLKAREQVPLPHVERWRLATELAEGMAYLHSRNIMHRDLKSKNCLLSRTHSLIIADFGLAHILTRQELKGVVGTTYWMAPEVLRDEEYGKPADVFSYGMVLCEILTRLKAVPDEIPRTNDFGLDAVAVRPLCGDCPEQLIDLAIACCTVAPSKRPSFLDILGTLQAMEAQISMQQ